jgi:phosphohistidine swiveling domain-containing protein
MLQATSAATTDHLVSLSEAATRRGEVGAKAANLGAALEAGFPVPDGVVVTAATLSGAFAGSDEALADRALPTAIMDSLQHALERLGGGPFAVRSSALAEDLADASYAGQYETVLGVDGLAAVAAAIRRCWASGFTQRVAAYERGRSATRPRGMAVLIQRLVPADSAGVAFTANPVSGAHDETLVSAVRGLGDRLVSGEVTPDEWTVYGDRIECRSAQGAIDAEQARSVAELARQVERHFGTPQDIEWAMSGGALFLLQARPITALAERIESFPVPVDVPEGFWERDASHFPLPQTPMNRSLFTARQNEAIARAFRAFGVLSDGLEFREIGGWTYARLVPPGGRDRPAPPAPLMWLIARLHPQLRDRLRAARRAIREDLAGRMIDRWHEQTRPDLQARIDALAQVDLEAFDDERLGGHWVGVESLLDDGASAHFGLHAPIALARKELADTSRDLLGWDEARAFELFAGLSTSSTAPALRLAELANMLADRPAVRALVERADREATARIADEDPEFAAALEVYQRQFGTRALRYEVAAATLAERPEITIATLRDQLRRAYDPSSHVDALAARRADMVAEARARLAGRPEQRARFERALQRAQAAHPVHEENEFYTLSVPLALARYALLEFGRRLRSRDVISEREDVFFLEIDELLTAFAKGGDKRALVARRKGQRAWALAHPGRATYGKHPGGPPPLHALPRESRTVMEAVLWVVDRIFATERSAQRQSSGTATINGIAASPGRYTGTVRVIAGEHEFGKLQAGDVLVCPVTSPVWSVLFSRIGGLVTDSGGILSHPAIIAREFGIPAVVATGNGTALLRDGQRVTVDGYTGFVEVGTWAEVKGGG